MASAALISVFGFDSFKKQPQEQEAGAVQQQLGLGSNILVTITDLTKLAAYVPGLNSVIGVSRVVFSYFISPRYDSSARENFFNIQVYRGIAEIFLGFFLVLPDVFLSVRV
jgi:hypothetical protein